MAWQKSSLSRWHPIILLLTRERIFDVTIYGLFYFSLWALQVQIVQGNTVEYTHIAHCTNICSIVSSALSFTNRKFFNTAHNIHFFVCPLFSFTQFSLLCLKKTFQLLMQSRRYLYNCGSKHLENAVLHFSSCKDLRKIIVYSFLDAMYFIYILYRIFSRLKWNAQNIFIYFLLFDII